MGWAVAVLYTLALLCEARWDFVDSARIYACMLCVVCMSRRVRVRRRRRQRRNNDVGAVSLSLIPPPPSPPSPKRLAGHVYSVTSPPPYALGERERLSFMTVEI